MHRSGLAGLGSRSNTRAGNIGSATGQLNTTFFIQELSEFLALLPALALRLVDGRPGLRLLHMLALNKANRRPSQNVEFMLQVLDTYGEDSTRVTQVPNINIITFLEGSKFIPQEAP